MNDRADSRAAAEADWWRVAREFVRPFRRRNPVLHRKLRKDLQRHWPHLVKATWAPLLQRAADDGIELRTYNHWNDWRRMLPAVVLEVAYIWAEDRAQKRQRPDEARSAAKELGRLDLAIQDQARHLADLLRQRGQLQERSAVRSHWDAPGLDLWQLIEAAAGDYPDWAYVSADARRLFLSNAASQSRAGPKLENVLRHVAASTMSPPRAEWAEDQAALDAPSGSTPGSPAEWVRQFFASINDPNLRWLNRPGETGRPLCWLTNRGIADLLSVVDGAKPGSPPFTEATVRDTRLRYLKGANL